jgi:hypothetical protein
VIVLSTSSFVLPVAAQKTSLMYLLEPADLLAISLNLFPIGLPDKERVICYSLFNTPVSRSDYFTFW